MRLTTLLPLLLLCGCAKSSAPLVAVDPTLSDGDEGPSSVHMEIQGFEDGHMSTHYMLITSARDAVIRGDLDAARGAMGWIAEHEPHQSIPASAMPYFRQMQGAARVAANMRTENGAATALSTLATVCSECHTALDTGPNFKDTPPPDDRVGVSWHMARHRWAADRMWEGMITNSELLWKLGVEGLREEPMGEHDLGEDGELSDVEQAMATWIHGLGDAGAALDDQGDRAHFYGGLLTACADCHRSMSEGVASP